MDVLSPGILRHPRARPLSAAGDGERTEGISKDEGRTSSDLK